MPQRARPVEGGAWVQGWGGAGRGSSREEARSERWRGPAGQSGTVLTEKKLWGVWEGHLQEKFVEFAGMLGRGVPTVVGVKVSRMRGHHTRLFFPEGKPWITHRAAHGKLPSMLELL